MDPQKVTAILDRPIPTELLLEVYQWILGNYLPITQLTKQNSLFCWTPVAQFAFNTLKRLITSAPILKHPDPALTLVLEVDA